MPCTAMASRRFNQASSRIAGVNQVVESCSCSPRLTQRRSACSSDAMHSAPPLQKLARSTRSCTHAEPAGTSMCARGSMAVAGSLRSNELDARTGAA